MVFEPAALVHKLFIRPTTRLAQEYKYKVSVKIRRNELHMFSYVLPINGLGQWFFVRFQSVPVRVALREGKL